MAFSQKIPPNETRPFPISLRSTVEGAFQQTENTGRPCVVRCSPENFAGLAAKQFSIPVLDRARSCRQSLLFGGLPPDRYSKQVRRSIPATSDLSRRRQM